MMKILLDHLVIPGTGDERRPARLLLENEIIAAVLGASEEATADRYEDLGGALVLPGAIDAHVHFDDPGFTDREDFSTGTRAAAAGGVTTVADMPCTSIPPVTSVEHLEIKRAIVEPKAHIDFMFWGGVSSNVLDEGDPRSRLEGLAAVGVAAIKMYFLSGMESFGDLRPEQARMVLEAAGKLGLPVGVHAEDRGIVEAALEVVRGRGGNGPLDYAEARPAEAEIVAVRTLRDLCAETGARAHVVHVGSCDALAVVAEARREGLPLSAETCPHYLLFTSDDLERLGALLKTAPVVKSARDREGLWRGLASGDLAFVASDHAAGVWPEEKNTGSIWTDYGGIPGVELLVPTLFSEGVGTGRITLQRLVEVTAAAPAEFLGIDHRKGRLAPGFDADLVVIDETVEWRVRAMDLHNKNRYTPLEGRTMRGRVRETWVRGRRVFERKADGTEVFFGPGGGALIRRGERR